MATSAKPRISPADYLAAERRAATKSEYLAGEVFAMSGASRAHGLIVANVLAALHAQLRGRPCEAYAADMRVRIATSNAYVYPYVVVVCGEARFEDAELDTLTNPTLVVEVLSPSTKDYDRGTKFAHYRGIESLRDYVVLAQDRVHVEHHERLEDGRWVLAETSDAAASVGLRAVGCTLRLADAYERVRFDAA